jgi:hypothetical protein
MAIWYTFLKFEFAGLGLGACCRLQYNESLDSFKFEKSAPNDHTFCSGLPHQTRSLSRIVCRGRSKGTFYTDIQANTLIYAIFLKTMSPQETRRSFKEIQVYFELMMSEHCEGRRAL